MSIPLISFLEEGVGDTGWWLAGLCGSLCTHRGAERGHTPVPGGDSEVVEGDVLAVQLSILPHPQLPFHWGDHKLPCQRWQGHGFHHATQGDRGQDPGSEVGSGHREGCTLWAWGELHC